MPSTKARRPVPIASVLAAVAFVATVATADLPTDGYMNHTALADAVQSLAVDHETCEIQIIGASRQGRSLFALTLADDPDTAIERPALLLVAGLDGRHLVGAETAVRITRHLLAHHADVLKDMTVYVIPRINPDGAELNFQDVLTGFIGTVQPVDNDRDGRPDEDRPQDLNGDGLITMMRRPNPPLDDAATHLADPAEPRLLKEPDAARGERAIYSVYVEGLDTDNDGLIAEDDLGSVDVDRNFMHEYPAHDEDAGRYQLSEPESLALAQFVLAHRNIVAAITYGRHDNLVNVPSGKGKDVSGRGPKEIDAADVDLYKTMSKVFEEVTGQERAPKERIDGSFHAWLYAQRGIPSFATVVWGRPDPSTELEEESGEAGDESGEEDSESEEAALDDGVSGTWTGTLNVSEMGDLPTTFTFSLQAGGRVTGDVSSSMFSGPVDGTYDPAGQVSFTSDVGNDITVTFSLMIDGDEMTGTAAAAGAIPEGAGEATVNARRTSRGGPGGAAAPGEADPSKPANEEDAAWLEYSDQDRAGEGFVEWQPFEHPTLGSVEIGGFVPLFRMNPPSGQLDELAEKQTAFVLELMQRRPQLVVEGPVVERLAPGLYDIRFGLVNEGYLPTATSMSSMARAHLPTVIRLSVPIEQIVAGDRVSRAWRIAGNGDRSVHHWIVRVNDGESIAIDIVSPQLGNQRIEFIARENDQ